MTARFDGLSKTPAEDSQRTKLHIFSTPSSAVGKRVATLGRFPLPVEVIPMASQRLIRQFAAFGGQASIRLGDNGPCMTDNGQHILDVLGLQINDPLAFESMVNQWPGVVTVGVFAHQKAQLCLLGTSDGVETVVYDGSAPPPDARVKT